MAGMNNAGHLQRVNADISPEALEEILARDGGLVLEGILSREDVAAINAELDVEMGPMPEGNWAAASEDWIAEFQGYKTKRLQHCVRYSPTYRERFLDNEVIARHVATILDIPVNTASLFASQAIEICPGEKAQALHRDAEPFHRKLGTFNGAGPELVMNTLLALTDITEEIGATRVVPGSHRWADFETIAEPRQTVPATMQAGDALLLTGRLVHGGGANSTANRSRRVISTSWSLGFFKSEEAWHVAVPFEEARQYPARVQRYLGLYSPSYQAEQPGFLWRVDAKPLEEHLHL